MPAVILAEFLDGMRRNSGGMPSIITAEFQSGIQGNAGSNSGGTPGWNRTEFQGPVSQKARYLIGPVKPFLTICISKRKQCIGFKLCMEVNFVRIKIL